MTGSAPGPVPDMTRMRRAVAAAYPALADADFQMLTAGWDSVALDGGGWIFKFPREEKAAGALVREATLLDLVRPAVTMRVPAMVIHEGPPLFSAHAKLEGEHLYAGQYERLNEAQRDALAEQMARFFAELHAMDQAPFRAAGVGGLKGWAAPEEILGRALPKLPEVLHAYVRDMVAAWQDLPADPHGTIFGYFDGHGWNMAFDHAAGRLNGIYDFGDCAFGDLQCEFIPPSWIARDLTRRIAARYGRLSRRAIDVRRVEILTAIMRLSELARQDDPAWHARAVENVTNWAAGPRLG